MGRLNCGALVAVAVALLLGIGAGIGAGALSVNETGFRSTVARMGFRLSGVEGVVACAVTLEGSFHSATFAETRGLEVGQMTRARSGSCTGGSVTLHPERLPWAVSFLATLVSPLGFTSSLFSLGLTIEDSGYSCSGDIVGADPPGTMTFRYDAEGAVTQSVDHNGTSVPVSGPRCEGKHVTLEGSALVLRANGEGTLVITQI